MLDSVLKYRVNIYFIFRTVVDLANSLSTYIQSEGRRPDLKVLDDFPKSVNRSGDGLEQDAKDTQHVSNVRKSEYRANIRQLSTQFDNENDSKNVLESNASDSSDLDETPVFECQKVSRPAFNCKKRLISHSK